MKPCFGFSKGNSEERKIKYYWRVTSMPILKSSVQFGAWWTALTIGFSGCFGTLNIPRLLRIVAHPAQAEAVVLARNCANNGMVVYSYTAANENHIGYSYLRQGCSQLETDERIRIYLAETDPSLSEADNPRAALFNELITIAAAGILAASFVVILASLWYWRPRRHDHVNLMTRIKRRNRLLAAVTAAVLIQAPVRLLKDDFRVLIAPGELAVMAIWGPHGPVSDDRIAMGVICGVNIIFYSLIISAVVQLIINFKSKLFT
jgi:hypothetical protein